MKKNKILILFIIIFLSLFVFSFSFALEVKNYPQFPGAPIITKDSTIADLVQYFFAVGIFFAGSIALISLAIAGVQLIIGQANPEGVSNAKDRIKGSSLGIVLLMVAYLILKSINPVLVDNLEVKELSSLPGIFYVKGNKEATCPSSETDASKISSEFSGGQIYYRCNTPNDYKLLIWIYNEKNFDSSGGADTIEINCDSGFPIPPNGSFRIAYKTPGIYIYNTSDCNGYRSNVMLTSGEIPKEFKKEEGGEFRCVEFLDDPVNKRYFGAIIHERVSTNGGGNCQRPIVLTQSSGTSLVSTKRPITIEKASSITIFNTNPEPKTSGDGVDFYSGPYGWDTSGSRSGVWSLTNSMFEGLGYYLRSSPEKLKFTYPPGVSDTEKINFPTFKEKQGSIRIKGNYIVALYDKGLDDSGNSQDGYCQVFRSNVVDLKGTEYISAQSGHTIEIIYSIATK